MIDDSYELYQLLEKKDLLKEKPSLWWPNYGTFEVVAGAILTQNTKWEKVEISLQNLRENNFLSLQAMAFIDLELLRTLIQPSGLYKSKASYLKKLAGTIIERYGNFETFAYEVDREWLLVQKGVGPETADSILCYACKRDVMVVDAYTARLLEAFGYSFERYDDLQEWCELSIRREMEDEGLTRVFAEFHGMIVEFVKMNSKGKLIDISRLDEIIL